MSTIWEPSASNVRTICEQCECHLWFIRAIFDSSESRLRLSVRAKRDPPVCPSRAIWEPSGPSVHRLTLVLHISLNFFSFLLKYRFVIIVTSESVVVAFSSQLATLSLAHCIVMSYISYFIFIIIRSLYYIVNSIDCFIICYICPLIIHADSIRQTRKLWLECYTLYYSFC